MERFEKLIQKAQREGCRILITFIPGVEEEEQEWGIKYYPDLDHSHHFYAYHPELETAAYRLLDELRGINL